MNKINILLPLYNDWRSCNFLLKKINNELKKKRRYGNILILNDASTQKVNIIRKKLENIKSIKILTTKNNIGSQKIISLGLTNIKNKKNEIVVIMDSDGEDDVSYLNNLIDLALKNKKYIITATRTRRRENYIFKLFYKLHLLITFIFTLEWISFGNYSSFHSQNLKKILKNNLSWLAYSSSILNNCDIYKVSSERQKRIFGKSKLSFFQLVKHSFRILSVFQKRILIISFFYILVLIIFVNLNIFSSFSFIILVMILLINYLINKTREITFKDYIKKKIYVKKIKKIK